MDIGVSVFFPNQRDWSRYLTMEGGAAGPARPEKLDHEVWAENLKVARLADELGFDSLWTWDHLIGIGRDGRQAVFEAWTTASACATRHRKQ